MNEPREISKRNLSATDALQVALDLMELLTAAPRGQVEAASFARDVDISLDQTKEIVELLQGLADEQTGSRVALDFQDGVISLSGDAGRLDPVRLTPAESLALRRALTHCNIADEVRERVETALCADGGGADSDDGRLMGGDRLLGGFYPAIAEAISIGARLEILYRADGETAPTARLVDPKLIEVRGDAAYLIAWNVEKDAQRSYRLDRMAEVLITEDSVEEHGFTPYSAAESLRAHGDSATLLFCDRASFDRRDWEGIHRDSICEREGRVLAQVSFTSKPWLFSQIAASAGAIEILDPPSLRSEFRSWAKNLM